MAFSWVPFYRELAERVLEFENRQDELLAVLREMRDEDNKLNPVPLDDDLSRTERVPLKELDPFTFIATFSRSGDKTAQALCEWIRQKWDLQTPTPTDFDGRANVAAVGGGSWFFASTEYGRHPKDIPLMWQLASAAFGQGLPAITESLYSQCIKVENIGVLKLSTGLFWFNSRDFLPLVGPMLSYLKEQGISSNEKLLLQKPNCKLEEYVQLMNKARALNPNFVALSGDAWNWMQNKKTDKPPIASTEPSPSTSKMPNIPLNQILYGPPGTGKTFNVVRRAVEIIEPGFFGDFKTRFEELRAKGQIGFVTFHQSFSYEEFIEGLRPVITDKVGEVRYEIREGILKTMAKNATQLLGASNDSSFDLAWKLICDYVAENPGVLIEGRSEKSRFELSIGKELIWGQNVISLSENNNFRCFKETARKSWDGLKDKADITGYDVQKYEQNVRTEGAFHAVILNKMRDLVKAKNEAHRFVLIIDEINRGNISKILGELITLLEDDKRLGADNELRLTLPVSGETFALPPNLFILGTMNTADKSLAQLDVALRRRFSFIEMAPDFSVCEGLPADIKAVLEELNKRIEWAIDREHRLGHASWMNVQTPEDFNRVWREKAMPLLVELFADNLEGLRELLGDGDNQNGFVRPFEAPKGMKGRARVRLYLDCENPASFDALATLKKNLGVV